ncbi:MAG: hypothetical protein SGCHY_005035 [Lobulomycetales sp.]
MKSSCVVLLMNAEQQLVTPVAVHLSPQDHDPRLLRQMLADASTALVALVGLLSRSSLPDQGLISSLPDQGLIRLNTCDHSTVYCLAYLKTPSTTRRDFSFSRHGVPLHCTAYKLVVTLEKVPLLPCAQDHQPVLSPDSRSLFSPHHQPVATAEIASAPVQFTPSAASVSTTCLSRHDCMNLTGSTCTTGIDCLGDHDKDDDNDDNDVYDVDDVDNDDKDVYDVDNDEKDDKDVYDVDNDDKDVYDVDDDDDLETVDLEPSEKAALLASLGYDLTSDSLPAQVLIRDARDLPVSSAQVLTRDARRLPIASAQSTSSWLPGRVWSWLFPDVRV